MPGQKKLILSFVTFFSLFIQACTTNDPPTAHPGKQLAFARSKGNCLACHVIEDGESPGNIGPPLNGLKERYKNKQQIKRQIRDASVFNPETSMPPYGRNNILSEDELDKIVDYLWSLD